jgi:hypothetical protein
MKRREFIILAGGVAIAALLPPAVRATAQQTAKIPRAMPKPILFDLPPR